MKALGCIAIAWMALLQGALAAAPAASGSHIWPAYPAINPSTLATTGIAFSTQEMGVKNGIPTTNQTAAMTAALNIRNTQTVNAYQLLCLNYTTAISVTNLTAQSNFSLVGSGADSCIIQGMAGSSGILLNVPAAQKFEIWDLSLSCNNVAGYTAALSLGTTTPFGTFGTLNQVVTRDCPSGAGAISAGNIVWGGTFYAQNTHDGWLSSGTGTSLFGISCEGLMGGICVRLALGDFYYNVEFEGVTGPSRALDYEQNSSVDTLIYSPGANVNVLHPIVINTVIINWAALSHANLLGVCAGSTTGCSTFGSSTSPQYGGTATAGGTNTLTDASAKFPTGPSCPHGCLEGGGIFITGGTGGKPMQFETIRSNTATQITTYQPWVTTPDQTSTYAVNQFVQHSSNGGATVTGGEPFSQANGFTYNTL